MTKISSQYFEKSLYGISLEFGILLLTILINISSAAGQELTSRPERGLIGKGTQAASEIDSVNLQNGSVSLAIPLASLPPMAGGKLGYTLTAYYNSKLWNGQSKEEFGNTPEPGCRPTYQTKRIVPGDVGSGWHIGTQYEVFFRDATEDYEYIQPESETCWGTEFFYMQGKFFKPMLRLPDGSEHEMRIAGNYPTYGGSRDHLYGYYQAVAGGPTFTSPVRFFTTDGTYLTVIYRPQSDPIRWTVYLKDGTKIEQSADGQRTIDRNGNSVLTKINYSGGYSFARDEHSGREIRWSSSVFNGSPATKVEYQTVGGIWQAVWVVWGTTNVFGKIYTRAGWMAASANPNENGPCFVHQEFAHQNIPVVREIILPTTNNEPAQKYAFQYNSDTQVQATYTGVRQYCAVPFPLVTYTGQATVGLGELSKITTPLGATVEYEYRNDNVHMIGPLNEDSVDDLLSSVLKKKKVTHDGVTDTWTYTIDATGAAMGGKVVNPDGSFFAESYRPAQVWSPGSGTDGLGGLQQRADHSGHTRVEKHWTLLGGELGSFGAASNRISYNPVVDTEYTTLLAADGTTRLKMSAKRFLYDYNGELLQTIEYDWLDPSTVPFENNDPNKLPLGIPSNVSARRVTSTAYHNYAADGLSNNAYHRRVPEPAEIILGKPYEVTIGDGTTVKSLSRFSYDGYAWGVAPSKGNSTVTSVLLDVTGQWVSTSAIFSPRGNVTSQTDANGNTTKTSYGSINGISDLYPTIVVQAHNTPVARTSTHQYDFHTGLVTWATDTDNNVSTATEYDVLGRPVKIRNAAGTPLESWTRMEYSDELRRVIVRSDIETMGDARSVSIEHRDRLGRVRLSRTLENATTENAYDERAGIKVETRYLATYGAPNGYSYQLTSNPFRAPTSIEATGEATMGWTRSKSWSTGRRTEVETFSGASLPAPWGSNSSTTGVVTTELDANAKTVTDQAGKRRRSLTDALGQLIRVDEPDNSGDLGSVTAPRQPTHYSYNTLGKMTHVQQGIQSRHFMYDSLGRLIRVRQPEQIVNQALNTSGNPGNNSWTAGFTYDANGNMRTSRDAKNVVITTAYDQLNRPLGRSYSDSTPAVVLTYDDPAISGSKGQLTKISSTVSEMRYLGFDSSGRLMTSEQSTDGRTYRSDYKYNLAGSLIEQKYPSGRVVKNFLDVGGDLSSIASKNANAPFKNYAADFGYTASGVVKHLRLGNGLWESAGLNSRQQVTDLNLGNSPTDGSMWRLNYHYGELISGGSVDGSRNTGNIAKQTISSSGLSASFVQTYRYDSLDRITQADETNNGNQTWSQTFGYDRYGNRISLAQNIGGQSLQINNLTLPTVDPATNRFQAAQGYSYDQVGNLIGDPQGREFFFNGDNKQVRVEDAQNNPLGEYLYDGGGSRVKKVTASETTVFVYDGFGKLIAENSTTTPSANPTVNYTATDTLGSPRVLTNSRGQIVSRRDFMPFGEELGSDPAYRTANLKYGVSDGVRQKFTGYQRDTETGLDFAEARYYNNTHGRFTAVDPLLASGKSTDPQTFNRYIYVSNNPVAFTDPLGLCPEDGDLVTDPCDISPTVAPQSATVAGSVVDKNGGILLPNVLITLPEEIQRELTAVGQLVEQTAVAFEKDRQDALEYGAAALNHIDGFEWGSEVRVFFPIIPPPAELFAAFQDTDANEVAHTYVDGKGMLNLPASTSIASGSTGLSLAGLGLSMGSGNPSFSMNNVVSDVQASSNKLGKKLSNLTSDEASHKFADEHAGVSVPFQSSSSSNLKGNTTMTKHSLWSLHRERVAAGQAAAKARVKSRN